MAVPSFDVIRVEFAAQRVDADGGHTLLIDGAVLLGQDEQIVFKRSVGEFHPDVHKPVDSVGALVDKDVEQFLRYAFGAAELEKLLVLVACGVVACSFVH